jgi:catechol 2,3-dioxygenase-like lactoylglutathione lyase family enzyme
MRCIHSRLGWEEKFMQAKIQSVITFLKTKDLDRTTHFYTHIMGAYLVLDQGSCRIFRWGPGAYLGFCLSDGETGSSEVVFTLVTHDVDAFASQLEDSGIALEVQPRFNPTYNIYQCFLRDPNGYLLEIQRFLDPDWEDGSKQIL